MSTEKPEAVHDEESSAAAPITAEGGSTMPHLTPRTIMAIISICLLYNSYLFTQLMPAVILSSINADLGPEPNYPWITICWNLGAAVIVTIGGRLSDIFGRRWFLISGAVFGAVGAVVGATGQSISQMIAAGVLMGIGGGFGETLFASVQEIVPNRYRLFILGCVEISNIPAMLSPMIGYTFISHTKLGWRACYWWMFAFETLTAIALFIFYRPPSFKTKHREDQKTKRQLLAALDYVGLLLFLAGCILLLLGLNWGGRNFAWKSVGVILPIVLSVVHFVALGFWEVYAKLEYPILPPRLFRKWRDFTSLIAMTFVGGMLYYSMNILWPRQSALLYVPPGDSTLQGVYANMFSFGTILAGIFVLTIVPRLGHERWQLIGFLVVQTGMIGSMGSVGKDDKAQAIATIIIVAASVTPPQYLAFGMISLGLESQEDIGISQGLLCTFRLIGGAIATAIYTAIQSNRYNALIGDRVRDAASRSGFTGDISGLLAAAQTNTEAAYQSVAGITDRSIQAVSEASKVVSAESYQLVYEVAVAFGGLAILVALTTRDIDKRKKTSACAVQLENDTLK
ncbi:fungal trichothecene efflux pump [Aspergillus pseudodeflectus]|uniref:Fungal trichothecene efflux pump n=1 Tax=Aspergillus pseudodeflectus TaxID=176178 RepID=A0ABR4KH82_9EURO